MGISLRAYARHRGVSLSAVQKAVAKRRIKLESDGTIDEAKADRDWAANSDIGATLSNVIGNRQKQVRRTASSIATETDHQMTPPAAVTGDPITVYLNARAANETYKARRAKAEYEQFMGELVKRSIANEYAATFSQMVRDHLMAMPDRLAPALAALDDVNSIHKLLTSDVRSLLHKLSKAISSSGF